MASRRNGTLYIGMTSDLKKRIYEHKHNLKGDFTSRNKVHMLVYYEGPAGFEAAVKREKQLKKWNRIWKLRIIEQMNPEWRDLYDDLL